MADILEVVTGKNSFGKVSFRHVAAFCATMLMRRGGSDDLLDPVLVVGAKVAWDWACGKARMELAYATREEVTRKVEELRLYGSELDLRRAECVAAAFYDNEVFGAMVAYGLYCRGKGFLELEDVYHRCWLLTAGGS